MNDAAKPTEGRRIPAKKLALVVLLGLGVAAAAGFVAKPRAVEVVRPVRAELVQTVVTNGRVKPPSRTSLGFEVMGTVVSVPVSEGQPVTRGELLAQLSDETARAQVDQARAALAQAEAQLARVRGTQARLADADVRVAELEVRRANDRLAREEALARSGATTAESIDEARIRRDSSLASLERARAALRGLDARGEEARAARASLERAQAELRSAQAALDKTSLRAPSDGLVITRTVEPGAVVQPGAALFEFIASGATELSVDPDETNLALLDVGQPALASAEPYPDRVFHARVARIAPSIDAARGTVEVVLVVPEPPSFLRPDMTVSVEIEVAREPHALVLPADLVHDLASDAPWVWVLEGDRARRRTVRLGIRGDERLGIAGGLAERDVVIRVADGLVDEGARVRAKRGR